MGIFRKIDRIVYDEDLELGISDIWPRSRVPSALGTRDCCYLVGRVLASGPGRVYMSYPELLPKTKSLVLPNVDFHKIPFVVLTAEEDEGHEFRYWRIGKSGQEVTSRKIRLSPTEYENSLTFEAVFE